jgi:hypothetical protein
MPDSSAVGDNRVHTAPRCRIPRRFGDNPLDKLATRYCGLRALCVGPLWSFPPGVAKARRSRHRASMLDSSAVGDNPVEAASRCRLLAVGDNPLDKLGRGYCIEPRGGVSRPSLGERQSMVRGEARPSRGRDEDQLVHRPRCLGEHQQILKALEGADVERAARPRIPSAARPGGAWRGAPHVARGSEPIGGRVGPAPAIITGDRPWTRHRTRAQRMMRPAPGTA